MLVFPISQRKFELYGLALEHGPNFEPYILCSPWMSEDQVSVGALLVRPDTNDYGVVVLRRQIDHRFVVTHQERSLKSEMEALSRLTDAMRVGEAPESLLPGSKKRQLLLAPGKKKTSNYFKLLTSTIEHWPALLAVGEIYLAMPNPDHNFVPDFQTGNFSSRLWELYLLACFREQGIHVAQQHSSPDFYLSRNGYECYVEAVTANPIGPKLDCFTVPPGAPKDRAQRLLGPSATRFAKTLRSKLQQNYEDLAHVRGKPFALALADFHAPGSLVWSRESLPSYLYGLDIKVVETAAGRKAVADKMETLPGEEKIPAGLFRERSMSHLSAVLFSNAATLAKFNRMGYLAGARPPNLKMIRNGHLYDRTPGALESIPFELDISSDEYAALWPGGEAWCQELEVFHNPLAEYPIDLDLFPGATHWFECDGEVVCSSMWQWSVLSSVTTLIAQ